VRTEFFVPIVRLRGSRYRMRIRVIRSLRFDWSREQFTEGKVYRAWLGPLLIIAMVDRAA
jgi:hypothetical protein